MKSEAGVSTHYVYLTSASGKLQGVVEINSYNFIGPQHLQGVLCEQDSSSKCIVLLSSCNADQLQEICIFK